MIGIGYISNFETIVKAVDNRDVCLVECKDIATGKTVVVLCAVSNVGDGQVAVVPLAKMFDGNPYDELAPPTEGEPLRLQPPMPQEMH